jgi:hypothetical protein
MTKLKSMSRSPEIMLLAMAFIMPLTFSVWNALLNNFVIETAEFSGREIGILHSLREIPGFMAFTAIFVLIILREQTFALLSLLVMSVAVAVTGYFPSAVGLYATTVIMSIGFHYFETMNESLTLQFLPHDDTAHFMGRALAVRSVASLIAYGSIWLLMGQLEIPYMAMYLIAGGLGVCLTVLIWVVFPHFESHTVQHKKIILRKRYGLYYALKFMSGARRQIFMVFAAFMMVEKFGYSVAQISSLFLLNYLFNLVFAPGIGRWIGKVGERTSLMLEYAGLFVVFACYAVVETGWVAASLYVLDHFFFALSIAINTYFQKIADPADIASNASVSFTINHIAAVVVPVCLGYVWLVSPSAVFWIGAAFAVISFCLALMVPQQPAPGRETQRFSHA